MYVQRWKQPMEKNSEQVSTNAEENPEQSGMTLGENFEKGSTGAEKNSEKT